MWLHQSTPSGQCFESPADRPFVANFPRPQVLKSLIIHPADKRGRLQQLGLSDSWVCAEEEDVSRKRLNAKERGHISWCLRSLKHAFSKLQCPWASPNLQLPSLKMRILKRGDVKEGTEGHIATKGQTLSLTHVLLSRAQPLPYA